MSLDKLLEDAVKNPIQRLVFMQKLVKSKVLVIGKTTIQKDAQGQETSTVSLMSIRNSKGEKAAPFFTSEEKLMEFLKTFTTRTPPVMQTDCIDFFRLSAFTKLGSSDCSFYFRRTQQKWKLSVFGRFHPKSSCRN